MIGFRALVFLVGMQWAFAAMGEPPRLVLQYKPAPALNPLRGLVPYSGEYRGGFPHSMEFRYVSYSALVKGYDSYDWTELENLLNAVSGRGHQGIFRVYLEYPGRSGVIPQFLIDDGLVVHKYLNTNTAPFPPQNIETPDYENANLRRSLKNFIAALGKKYDGDNRIAFITAGLLGTWGEWHDYPREELFASKTVQNEVMDAYASAFRTTPILLRYPRGLNDRDDQADNSRRPFGYHDDSFAWATLDTGKPEDDWYFMPAMARAGFAASAKWKRRPIGGEIRPEAWGLVFDTPPGNPEIQDFRACVEATHASWLMDSGMFGDKATPARKKQAEIEVQRMGYELHVPAVTIGPKVSGTLNVVVELANRGVAPFYYDWRTEFALVANRQIKARFPGTGKIHLLLPGEANRVWQESLDVSKVPAGTYQLAVRAVNPLPNGVPLRFANTTQDRDFAGWLSLGEVTIP